MKIHNNRYLGLKAGEEIDQEGMSNIVSCFEYPLLRHQTKQMLK